MKAASLVLQFVIFFMIGLGFFIAVGNIFRFQSGLIRGDIIDSASELSVIRLSAVAVKAVDSCKSCENASIKIDQPEIAGYTPAYKLSAGIMLEIEPEGKTVSSSMHNLYKSVKYSDDVVLSNRISMTYDRTNNNLVIG